MSWNICIALAIACLVPLQAALAMDVKVVGDQVIMSGPIDGGELAKLHDVVADHGSSRVRTVVLRDSPGGDLWTSMRVGEFIRDKGWRTAVSGHCFSGCAIIFLGGVERQFTDDKPVLHTQLALHAAYFAIDSLRTTKGDISRHATYDVVVWIKKHTGGRMSDSMLERFENLAKTEVIVFFDAKRMPRSGQTSVITCSHAKEAGIKCKPIAGTDVFREGIVTSAVLVRSNDRAEAGAATPGDSAARPQDPAR